MTDREIMQMALDNICAARLCEVNSMSSRREALRLLDKAADALRERLARQEQYESVNPLGGPAKVFDAIADAIRAGDDYHATMRRYGYAEARQEPVAHSVVAGALFDFMGWLTTRSERLALSSTDDATPAADAIKDFAEMRGLSINDARVQEWQRHLTAPQPEQDQEPTGWITRAGFEVNKHTVFTGPGAVAWRIPLYTTPQPRQWQGLTDEEAEDIWNCYCDEMGEASINDAPDIARAIEAKLKERNA